MNFILTQRVLLVLGLILFLGQKGTAGEKLNPHPQIGSKHALHKMIKKSQEKLPSLFLEGHDFTKGESGEPQTFLENLDLSNAKLDGANFSKMRLHNVIFKHADMNNVNFEGAELEDVTFIEADLRGSNFKGVKALDVNFRGSLLNSVNFEEAYLSFANFSGCNLRCVNFKDADLLQANFRDSDLRCASLDKAKRSTDANLDNTQVGCTSEDNKCGSAN